MPKAGKRKNSVGKQVSRLPMVGDISQVKAKEYLPPLASVWKNNRAGGWCGHLPPYARIQRLHVQFGGEREALRSLLQELWNQYFVVSGEDVGACHVEGLFCEASTAEASGNAAGAGASASSASAGVAASGGAEQPPAKRKKRR